MDPEGPAEPEGSTERSPMAAYLAMVRRNEVDLVVPIARKPPREGEVWFNNDMKQRLGQSSLRVLLREREIKIVKNVSRRGRSAGGTRSRQGFKSEGLRSERKDRQMRRRRKGGGPFQRDFSLEMAILISVSGREYLGRTQYYLFK